MNVEKQYDEYELSPIPKREKNVYLLNPRYKRKNIYTD